MRLVEWLSFAEQLALQGVRLPVQIERVRAGSLFYRDRLGPVRTLAELAAQPFVTKAELLAAQADDPPLGPHAGVAAGGDEGDGTRDRGARPPGVHHGHARGLRRVPREAVSVLLGGIGSGRGPVQEEVARESATQKLNARAYSLHQPGAISTSVGSSPAPNARYSQPSGPPPCSASCPCRSGSRPTRRARRPRRRP